MDSIAISIAALGMDKLLTATSSEAKRATSLSKGTLVLLEAELGRPAAPEPATEPLELDLVPLDRAEVVERPCVM